MNNYYVYELRRRDNDTCIYVGQGHGTRINSKYRNEKQMILEDTVGVDRYILFSDLSRTESLEIEHEVIRKYIEDDGYGIDIEGFRGDNPDRFLTNHTFGGAGLTGLKRPRHSEIMKGSNNPMYGINIWESYSSEKADSIKKKIFESSSGRKNPMYGVSPKERMDENTYLQWYEKNSQRCKAQIGEKNPNAKKVDMFNNGELIAKFKTIIDAAQWMIDKGFVQCALSTVRSSIGQAIKTQKEYKGFSFTLAS